MQGIESFKVQDSQVTIILDSFEDFGEVKILQIKDWIISVEQSQD